MYAEKLKLSAVTATLEINFSNSKKPSVLPAMAFKENMRSRAAKRIYIIVMFT